MQNPDSFPPFRPHAEGPTGAVALERFPLEERIVVVLAQQPWASAGDIVDRLDVSESEINKACDELEENKKLIAGRDLGVTSRGQRRYILTRRGVMHVTRPSQHRGLVRAALPLTWQMTEDGVTRMLLWMPMVESLYEILPTFWTGGLAVPFQWRARYAAEPSCSSYVWLGEPTLTDVRWLPSGRLHAVAIWQFERHDGHPRYYHLPFLWAGLLPQEDYRSRSLRLGSRFIRCLHDSADPVWWDKEPPVVVIGPDQFAAFRARTAYGEDVKVGSVDTAGTLVWSAEASHSEWTLGDRTPQARSIGHPEAAAIGEGPDLVNLGGVREERICSFLADFRAATRANLVKAFRMSGSSVTTALKRLENRGLIERVGRHLYITRRGVDMLAARDRVDADRLVEVTHLDPEGEAATRERDHDSAVAEVAAAFLAAGMPVVAGWRWVVSWSDGQLVPDLWVLLPVPGREEGIWIPIEIEFSAKGERRIGEKLRSYRLAPIRLRRTFPLLVITGEEKPAKLFDDLSGDLPVLTTTLGEFRAGVWEGPESVWRRGGLPARLSDFARDIQSPHLRQPLGRSLNHNKPSLDDWMELIRKELVWSDPTTADLGWEPPPINLPPRTEREERSEDAPVSPPTSPTPPAPSPAPAGGAPTAQERARQRSEALSRIDPLVATAARQSVIRLLREDLSDEERLCLQRVRAIITHGANRHLEVPEEMVEQSLQRCLMLEDEHRSAIRSRNMAWAFTVSRTQTDPRRMFRDLLKDYPSVKEATLKRFDDWSKLVDAAARAARKARTLQ